VCWKNAAILPRGYGVMEYRFLCADGRYRWMRDTLRTVENEDGIPKEFIGS
jgi:PAS domain-containing protein